MNKYDYVAENVDIDSLVRGPRGLRLDAKVSYREGHAMLSVYGFWPPTVLAGRRGITNRITNRIVLQRVFVPSDMPKADKHNTLRAMCDLICVQHGESYYLRSKLK
jgi:hypothetical protein